MQLPKLTAVIEKEGKWYVATCPELGVASQGRTNDEAESMLQEAVELLLEEADEAEGCLDTIWDAHLCTSEEARRLRAESKELRSIFARASRTASDNDRRDNKR